MNDIPSQYFVLHVAPSSPPTNPGWNLMTMILWHLSSHITPVECCWLSMATWYLHRRNVLCHPSNLTDKLRLSLMVVRLSMVVSIRAIRVAELL